MESTNLMRNVLYLISVETKLEFKQRSIVGSVLLYTFATTFICYLSFKSIVQPHVWNALYWIIVLFASVNAVSKSFMAVNSGRQLYLYTMAAPREIIVSKIIYNAVLVAVISLMSFFVYSLFVGSLVQDNSLFILVVLLGSFGFSSILTLMSSIASKTNNNFSLMAILSMPLLVPLLITLMRVSKNAIDGLAWSVSYKFLFVLVLLNIIVFVLSYLLFPYLWRD